MRTSLSIALLLVLSSLGLGCANDGASLFILNANSLNDECAIDTVPLTRGVVDASLVTNYVAALTFAGQLRDRNTSLAANPNDMRVHSVDIEIRDANGDAIAVGGQTRYRVPASAFIESFAGTGDVPTGQGTVELLPPGYVTDLAGQLGVSATSSATVYIALRPLARTNGGTDVEGNFDFEYPITVCDGCLSRCATSSDDMVVTPCLPGQDDVAIVNCP